MIMKEAIYKLETPVDGVKEIVLFAPSRKQLKFAAFIKSSFMSVAVEMAGKMDEKDKKEYEKKDEKKDKKISGRDMLLAMYAGSIDVGEMIDRFIDTCTESTMCRMNGSPVPKEFWNTMSMVDMEGLFAEFIENFITI